MITEQQYQRLMKTYNDSSRIDRAAMKAGVHRGTAAKYLKKRQGPQALPRQRRRADPVLTMWPEALRFLELSPELEAKALFEHLLASQSPGQAAPAKALRTFQRRVQAWRRRHGPPKEVFFPQVRQPGEVMQLDWTHADELGVTIADKPFAHLLCHAVLAYSNVQWAVPCRSESMLSLKIGLQEALHAFGGTPLRLQTDQSSTATHTLKRGEAARGFNTEYLALCEHLGLEPRTINKASPQENGDIESANGHLKRRLKTHLALRGSRDFASESDYASFLAQVCRGANALRHERFAEERPTLRALPARRYPEAEEVSVRVSSFSTIRVKQHAYSVPAHLIGAIVQVEITEQTLVVRHDRHEVLRCERATTAGARIDYRHVIASLARKPGAFAGYQYREELFPRVVFRQAYDALHAAGPATCERRYVELLALAAEHGEDRVAAALGEALRAGLTPDATALLARVRTEPPPPPQMAVFLPELNAYDELLTLRPSEALKEACA